MAQEDILIRIHAIDEFSATLEKASKSIQKLTAPISRGMKNTTKTIVNTWKPVNQSVTSLQESLNIAGMSMGRFNKAARENMWQVTNNGQVLDKLNGRVLDNSNVVRQATKEARRFKFEWLSIMFTGMALDRMFGSLVQKQFQLFGITDMLGAAWTTVLLPIMEAITPLIYTLVEAFMNMPDSMKLVVGAFILLGAIAGKVLTIVGQGVLAAMGFAKIFGGGAIIAGVKGIGAAFLGLGAPVLLAIAAIIAIVIGMYLAWKNNFLGMKNIVKSFITEIKQYLGGLISIVKGILDIVVGLFTGDFEKVKRGVIRIFKGLFNMVVGMAKMSFYGMAGIIIGAFQIVWNMIKVIIDGIKYLYKKARSIASYIGSKMSKFLLGSFQSGGVVPQTGPYLLHAGEHVIPKRRAQSGAGGIATNPTFIINANIGSSYDVRQLASELNRYWAADFERLSKSRGSR